MSEGAEVLALDEVAYLGPDTLRLLEGLFEPLDDVVYVVKDGAGRYRSANRSLWRRCGLAGRAGTIGAGRAPACRPELRGSGRALQRRVTAFRAG